MSKHRLTTWLPLLIFIAALAPLCSVRYLPLYDYQNHLLEAQVVVHYDDPALAYAESYSLRPDWLWRSNALTTLLLIFVGNVLPIGIAGKLVVAGYMALLIGGLTALLAQQQRPIWHILAAAPLINSLMLTGGMLNAAYAFALTPWILLCYLRWQQQPTWHDLAALALLSFLQYMAHGLGWALCILVLGSLASYDRLSWKRSLLLILALSSVAPTQFLTRPAMTIVPALLITGCIIAGLIARSLRLRERQIVMIGLLAAAGIMLLTKLFKAMLLEYIPGLDFSLNAKFLSLPRLFTLPIQTVPIAAALVYANLAIVMLVIIVGLTLCWRLERRWLAPLGLLGFLLLITPYRTVDVIVIEPRILLVMALLVVVASQPQTANVSQSPSQRPMQRLAMLALCMLAVLHLSTAALVALRYDAAAHEWASTLAQIGPAKRVLVLSNPHELAQNTLGRLARLGQVFDGNQFSATYALEHGGFVSNTFYNGPLLPQDWSLVPDYWAPDLQQADYLAHNCEKLRQGYDRIIAWNAADTPLTEALRMCSDALGATGGELSVWVIR